MMQVYKSKRVVLLKYISCLLCVFLLQAEVHSQSATRYTIKGQVTDEDGQAIPGATLLLAGTSIGTNSDAGGNYTLSATVKAGPATLVVSAIGYETVRQPIALGAADQLSASVQLKSSTNNLNDLVVVGSTIQTSRRELGNAITTLKAQDLAQSGSGGLLNSLQGKIPGAQITQNSGDPAGGISVRLRGVKSLSGSSDPLYVIDGVIVSNSSDNVSQLAVSDQVGRANPGQNRLADLNPDDIESLNVINGAAAAAQYGSRAANGVVLITTKRGKSGAPRLSFMTSFNVNELRKAVPLGTFNKQFGFAGLRLHPIGGISAAQLTNPGVTTAIVTRDGADTRLATNLVDVTRFNYFDQIFQTGTGTDNSLSLSGGTDQTQYFVSVGYLTNQGIIKDTDFRRYNIRARLDQRITSWAKLSAGLSYVNSFSNEKANGNVFYSPINSINITNNTTDITVRDRNGNLQAVEPTRVNPLSTIEDMAFTQAVSRTTGNLQLNLTPAKGLTVDGVVGIDTYTQFGKSYIRPYPYQAAAGLPLERYPNGFAGTGTNLTTLLNADLNVGYERQLTSSLKLNMLGGFNYQFQQQDLVTNSGQNLAPFITAVPGAANNTFQLGYILDRYNLSGFFGQATVGFKNLAFLTAAIRRDRSSKFSEESTNQNYPKLSASVVVSDLDFWKNSGLSGAFSSLKVRGSYGQAGNLTGVGSFSRFWLFNPVAYLGRGTLVPSGTLANPQVRPERMTELEAGADLSFWNDKINLGMTVYRQEISDLVVNRVLAPSDGGTGIINNVGIMENRGMEIMLDIAPIRTADFELDFTFIYNRNRNKVLKLGNPTVEISNSAGAPVFLLEGKPASVFYGFPYARNADTLLLTPQRLPQRERGTQAGASFVVGPENRNAAGQPTGGVFVRSIIGDPNPDWTGSFATNIRFKRASLRVLLDAVQGVEVFNADKRTRENVGIGVLAEQEMRGTLTRGYIFSIGPIDEFRVDDGSFVKLREVALNYQLPKIKGFNSLNLSLIGRNLISWDNYNGFDPETNAGGNADLLRGVDFGNVPIPRTYRLQLSASF